MVFVDCDLDHCDHPFSEPVGGAAGVDTGGDWHAVAGGFDGVAELAIQPGEYHDAATGDRHRGDEWDSYPEPIRGGTHARHIGAEHGEGGISVGIDGHSRIRQFGAGAAPGDSQSGRDYVGGHRHVYGCGADIFAGTAEFAGRNAVAE